MSKLLAIFPRESRGINSVSVTFELPALFQLAGLVKDLKQVEAIARKGNDEGSAEAIHKAITLYTKILAPVGFDKESEDIFAEEKPAEEVRSGLEAERRYQKGM